MTMRKLISLLVLSVFTATAFAQISLDSPGTERKKNHRGYKRPGKIKRPKH